MPLRDDGAIGLKCSQDVGVEELANLGGSAVLGSRLEVVAGLRFTVLRTEARIPCTLSEKLRSHELITALVLQSVATVNSNHLQCCSPERHKERS